MSNTPNPLFKFSREGFSVRVNNIADAGALSRRSPAAMCLATASTVSRREILDLFNNLIGASSSP